MRKNIRNHVKRKPARSISYIIEAMKTIIRILLPVLCAMAALLPAKAEDIRIDLGDFISDYAYIVDYESGQVISDKRSAERIHPASMTKIMTAIVAIENLPDLNERIPVTERALAGLREENASVAGFNVGDEPTVLDLLYGVALPSGADACNVLAYRIAGSIEGYVGMMNDMREKTGMVDTHFVNTTGITDADHYTTCRDMASLLAYCVQNETFRTVFSAHYVTTTTGLHLSSTIWSNADRLGLELPGYQGAKTGFTYSAGHCIAAWAYLGDMPLAIVLAHSDTDMAEPTHIKELDKALHTLSAWKRTIISSPDQPLTTITVHHRNLDESIEVSGVDFICQDLPIDTDISVHTDLPSDIQASIAKETLDGSINITVNGVPSYAWDVSVEIPAERSLMGKVSLWFDHYLGS